MESFEIIELQNDMCQIKQRLWREMRVCACEWAQKRTNVLGLKCLGSRVLSRSGFINYYEY